jgi:fumarate reductase subunit C
MGYVAGLMFFAVPIMVFITFIVSLVLFFHGKHINKRMPGSISAEVMKERKIFFIVMSSVTGAMAVFVSGIVLLLYSAVVYM